jgi:hypothetical protein
VHHDIPCPYCKKYGKENILEYIPDRLQYYCKHCEYNYSEDTINAEQPKHRTAKAPKKAEPKAVKIIQPDREVIVTKEEPKKKEPPKTPVKVVEKKEEPEKVEHKKKEEPFHLEYKTTESGKSVDSKKLVSKKA